MPKRASKTGSELFVVDNSETDWKVVKYIHDWCHISKFRKINWSFIGFWRPFNHCNSPSHDSLLLRNMNVWRLLSVRFLV